MTKPDITQLPNIQLDGDEPVFDAPWKAQAFAIALNLYQNGCFDWNDWADALSREIHSGEERSYYAHWLVALEKIVAAKKLTTADALEDRRQAWHDAAARTPHGAAITLK